MEVWKQRSGVIVTLFRVHRLHVIYYFPVLVLLTSSSPDQTAPAQSLGILAGGTICITSTAFITSLLFYLVVYNV